MKRKKQEQEQNTLLSSNNIKILLAGHPYNLYDDLIGKTVIDYLTEHNITILYSNKIDHNRIKEEYQKGPIQM